MSSLLAVVLTGLAVGAARGRTAADSRLDRLPGRAAGAAGSGASARRVGGLCSPRAASVLAGAAVALLGGSVVSAAAGLAVALWGPRLLARLEPAAVRRERERLLDDLPSALDLLAACLAGGASLAPAARAVSTAVAGPCGDRLGQVAAALEVGTAPDEAWALLRAGDGDDPLAAASRSLARASTTGAPVAAAVNRLAADARARARGRGQQAARRAGVLAVAPLGLCFLPAFVLLGVVPLVAGLVRPLLAGL